MSLNVYLTSGANTKSGSGIFVRENGQMKEISRAEWDERFPGREPIIANPIIANQDEGGDEVYSANITHNLNRMASEAGIYEFLWQPDRVNISKANQLVTPLRKGLILLKSDPWRFKRFDSPNGWGTYEGLIIFVQNYLKACEQYPEAVVSVWR